MTNDGTAELKRSVLDPLRASARRTSPSACRQEQLRMNEHQHSGENIGGRRDSPLASAGGNSPVLGSPMVDSGRSAALDRSGPQQFGDRRAPSHAEVSHRMAAGRDETRRAGEHQYEYGRGARRPPDTQQDYNPLIVAASLGGGAVLGWLLARLSSPHRRERN